MTSTSPPRRREMNAFLGLPLSYCGGFAIVFKVVSPGGDTWAVKCFTRQVTDHQQRYSYIARHLEQHKRRFAVEFGYLQEGIKVGNVWYPCVKMRWVEGHTLNEFLRGHAHQPALLDQLGGVWLRLASELRESRMAHGDLQHGNVLLVPGKSASSATLRLVDYDGMWVPELDGRPPGEHGHPNYQHPRRLESGGYTGEIDRFSNLLVYTSLRCLWTGGKAMWDRHDNGENLLFKERDFAEPSRSKLLPELLDLGDVDAATLTGHLITASQGPLEAVPLLADLVTAAGLRPLSGEQRDRLGELVPSAKNLRRLAAPATKPASAPEMAVKPPAPEPPQLRKRETPAGAKLAVPLPAIVGGSIALLALASVGAWMLLSGGKPKDGPAASAMTAPRRVEWVAGETRPIEVSVAWEEGTDLPTLTAQLSGSPRGVTVPRPAARVRDGKLVFEVRVETMRQAEPGKRTLKLAMGRPDGTAEGASVEVELMPPPRPRLGNLEALTIRPDSLATVAGLVFLDGPLPPLTVRLAKLPAGAAQGESGIDRGGKMTVGLVATAPTVGDKATVELELLEAGEVVARQSFGLEVLPAPTAAERKLVMDVPARVVLKPGEVGRATVPLTRTNVKGPITLKLEGLPTGVDADPVTVSEEEPAGEVLFAIGKDAAAAERVVAKLVALVGAERFAERELVLRVEKAAAVAVVPPMPKAVEPKAPRAVRIATCDGLSLAGTLYPVGNPTAGATVLLLHDLWTGAGHTRKNGALTKTAMDLQSQGHTVLTFDFRGHGESAATAADLPPAFYSNWHANRSLLSTLRNAKKVPFARVPPTYHYSLFPPWYQPWVVQDIVAARHFLDRLHEDREANTRNLVVVAAGESSYPALLWAMTEGKRFADDPAVPTATDVRRLFLVGPPAMPGTSVWGPKSNFGSRLSVEALPVVTIAGEATAPGSNQLFTQLRRVKTRTIVRVNGAGPGAEPLKSEGVKKELRGALAPGELRGWRRRDLSRVQINYQYSGITYVAVPPGAAAPQSTPLLYFGIGSLDDR